MSLKTGWVKGQSALNEGPVNSEILVFYEHEPGEGKVGEVYQRKSPSSLMRNSSSFGSRVYKPFLEQRNLRRRKGKNIKECSEHQCFSGNGMWAIVVGEPIFNGT